jgi:hypothetical protein
VKITLVVVLDIPQEGVVDYAVRHEVDPSDIAEDIRTGISVDLRDCEAAEVTGWRSAVVVESVVAEVP